MYEQFVFCKPSNATLQSIYNQFELTNTFSNDRTKIWENSNVVFSEDQRVVRVFLYDGNDKELIKNIKDSFYEKQY